MFINNCKKSLEQYLKSRRRTFGVDRHSITTEAWSKGFLKGYEQAIEDVSEFVKKRCDKE